MALRPYTGWGERGGGMPSPAQLDAQDYRRMPGQPPEDLRPSPMMPDMMRGGEDVLDLSQAMPGVSTSRPMPRLGGGPNVSTAAPVPMPNRQSLQREALLRLLQGGGA